MVQNKYAKILEDFNVNALTELIFVFQVSVDASNSRVIVFSTYRESVHEITELLLRHKPMIKAMSFIGQGNQGTSVTSSLTSSIKDEPQNILLGEDEVGLEECDANESLEGKTLPVKKSKGLTQTQQKRVSAILGISYGINNLSS